ncbi:hypothetical protein AAF712_016302 [Marasmius tenuissimus]|uniref:Uncharacterized protein n=1 Tax=Marasmius tenuissimus TaxID=585030 RepID=A0ABR2Z813_9AGAR
MPYILSPERVWSQGSFDVPDDTGNRLITVGVLIEEERIIRLLMDPFIDQSPSAIGPTWVRCLPCGKRVGLRGNMRFWPERWLQHRHECREARDAVKALQRSGTFVRKEQMEDIKYADKSDDKEEARLARGMYGPKIKLLRRIARYECSRGQSPWARMTEPPPAPPLQSPHASRTVSATTLSAPTPSAPQYNQHQHHHQQHRQQHHPQHEFYPHPSQQHPPLRHYQQFPEQDVSTRFRNGSLTLPPLQGNTVPVGRLPSVEAVLTHATNSTTPSVPTTAVGGISPLFE